MSELSVTIVMFISFLNVHFSLSSGEIPIVITLITENGASDMLRDEVREELVKVEQQLEESSMGNIEISINITTVDRFGECQCVLY